MLTYASKFANTAILSVQPGRRIATISELIIDPDNLKIVAFRVNKLSSNNPYADILSVSSIREYSQLGLIIDTEEEFVEKTDIIKISQIIDLNFDLIDLKVETKKRSKLGKIIDYTFSPDDFLVQQIVVKRPTLKRLLDDELIIPRKEIIEVNDYKVIVKNEEKTIKDRAGKEDFVPNFVNPFRKSEQDFAPARTKTPADKDN